MLQEIINKGHRKSFGPVVLLLPIFFLALILCFSRAYKVRLRTLPKVMLFNTVSLGNSNVWGAIIITLASLILLPALSSSVDVFMLSMPVSFIVIGIVMMRYPTLYNKHLQVAEALTQMVSQGHTIYRKESQTFGLINSKKVVISLSDFVNVLIDLNELGVVDYKDLGDSYQVNLIDPDKKEKEKEKEKEVITLASWNCRNCGATGNTGSKCEYCNTEKTI